MKHYCPRCQKTVIDPTIPRCSCGNVYELVYEYSDKLHIQKRMFETDQITHWKYHDFMPLNYHNIPRVISMGEGGTPLIHHPRESDLFFKMESNNPTGAFKDRASALEITLALNSNKDTVVVASTGNMGASIATYAAYAGLKCMVFIPNNCAIDIKIRQISAMGAIIQVIGGTYTDAMLAAEKYYVDNIDTVYLAGDYGVRVEGTKSIGYEIWEQLDHEVPDYIIVPVGNGTLLWAIYKAFKDLQNIFNIKMPKIIGIRPENARTTKIGAVACPKPNAEFIINQVAEQIITVSDDKAYQAKEKLAYNGIFVETAGALSYAALENLKLSGIIICIATGHGLKEI